MRVLEKALCGSLVATLVACGSDDEQQSSHGSCVGKTCLQATGDSATVAQQIQAFTLPQPSTLGKTLSLWATYYFLPRVSSLSSGFALRNLAGTPLGPQLSRRDWCTSAMEGSVYVTSGPGAGKTYNYAGTSTSYKVDCSAYFRIDVSRTKFRLAKGSYGDGVSNFVLVPYRTVAVDPATIPYGSVLYIPAARGTKLVLPSGSPVTHDGFFFAADTGGAIKGTHIDVFLGPSQSNPFGFVKSTSSAAFRAYVLPAGEVAQELRRIHVP